MAARPTTRRPAKKAAPVKAVEPEELEEDLEEELEDEVEEDDDLEELEEDEAVDEKPAAKGKKKAADTVTFGIRDLVSLIKKETGEDTDPRALRTLIRKMARDKSGRVDREITAGNRTRYDWSGPNDKEVREIVKAFKAGELEEDKQEKLKALKERKAAQTAAKKKAAAEVEELGEEEDDEEEAPAPRRRRPAAKKTAPAARRRKAAPVEEVEDDEELDLDEE